MRDVSSTRRATASVRMVKHIRANSTLPRRQSITTNQRSAQRFLLDISAEFISRDYETTLKRLAFRAVPFIADFCFTDVLSVEGTIQRGGPGAHRRDQARTLR